MAVGPRGYEGCVGDDLGLEGWITGGMVYFFLICLGFVRRFLRHRCLHCSNRLLVRRCRLWSWVGLKDFHSRLQRLWNVKLVEYKEDRQREYKYKRGDSAETKP